MKKSKNPPKWVNIYPQGTKEGDEEQSFFIALSRHPEWTWRSTAHLAKAAKISLERVDEILQKYWKKGMVFQNPLNEDQWGYWERVWDKHPEMKPKVEESITEKDHHDRIKKASNP